jgi:hypothetical protein
MTVDPLIPGSLWLALAVAGAALLTWYALRRPGAIGRWRWGGVIGLMGGALLIVLLILLNPIRVTPLPPPPGKPLLTVLVDATASMAVRDTPNDRQRYAAACDVARTLSQNLREQFEVRTLTFGNAASATSADDLSKLSPEGKVTDIADAITAHLDPDHPAGQAMVLLSDGGHNAGEFDTVSDAVNRAKALDAPIYTETFGGEGGGLNLAAGLRSTQELAFIGQQVPVNVTVSQHGATGARVGVALLCEGKEIQRQNVDLARDTADVSFRVSQTSPGVYPYEVRVDPLPGELTQADNTATYLLRVIDHPVRVLLLEGKPYWDSKFLVRTLASVPAVELDSLVRVSDGRLMQRTVTRDATASQPATASESRKESWKIVATANDALSSPERLRQYQIIVLGRDAEAFLTEQGVTNLQSWVTRDGGALVCYRGSPVAQVNQSLARMLPVRWQPTREARFRPRLTASGRDLHWFESSPGIDADTELLGMPTLAASEQVDRTKPAATVLATAALPGGGESPVVVYQPYGTGRAVVIEGAGMWRWAFLPPEFQQRDATYTELWHSLLRWLTSSDRLLPGQQAFLRSDKVVFDTIEPAVATLIVRQNRTGTPKIELAREETNSAPTTFTAIESAQSPDTFTVNFGKLAEGRYQARLAGGSGDVAARTVFDVRAAGQEQREPQARPDRMNWIATTSGGQILNSEPASQIAKHFQQHLAVSHPPQFERTTAWDRPWLLLLVIFLWTCSWALRRSGGLV